MDTNITVTSVARNGDVTNKLINHPLDYIPTVSVQQELTLHPSQRLQTPCIDRLGWQRS
jgi:hypothetical protein